jgi:hypothetical protein
MKYKIGQKVILKEDVLEGCHDSDTDIQVLKECNNVVTIESISNNVYYMEEVAWFYPEREIEGPYNDAVNPIDNRFEILDL